MSEFISNHERFPVPSTSAGCAGSIRWGIDHGRCYSVRSEPFDVLGYDRTTTDAMSHFEAAQFALWKDDRYCVWIPNGTILSVWRVGPKHNYMLFEEKRYRVFEGEPFPVDAVIQKENEDGNQ